jgi:hypothetical protein
MLDRLCIDLADAEVSRLAWDGALLRVRLAASPGWPVVDGRPQWREPVHARGVELVFGDARVSGDAADALGRLSHARLRHAGGWLRRLDLPGALAGPVLAEWRFGNGCELVIEAPGGVRCDWLGAPDFGPSMAC